MPKRFFISTGMTSNVENNKYFHKLGFYAFELIELVVTSKYQDLEKTVYDKLNNHTQKTFW